MTPKEQKQVFDVLAVELAGAVTRLSDTMPALTQADGEFVFKAGMGYFAEMLAKHFGMQVTNAAIAAMSEYGHFVEQTQAGTQH